MCSGSVIQQEYNVTQTFLKCFLRTLSINLNKVFWNVLCYLGSYYDIFQIDHTDHSWKSSSYIFPKVLLHWWPQRCCLCRFHCLQYKCSSLHSQVEYPSILAHLHRKIQLFPWNGWRAENSTFYYLEDYCPKRKEAWHLLRRKMTIYLESGQWMAYPVRLLRLHRIWFMLVHQNLL